MKGIVYKIYCKDSSITEFYVGSSCDLQKRKYTHKYNCSNNNSPYYNLKVYRYIRNNGGYDNWEFEILLQVEVENKEELRSNYEAKYQLDLKPSLNSQTEGRTPKEWRENNKEKIKQYYKDNKEEIKQYYQDNKEEIKQYYQDNKEELKEKIKIYKINNKEEIFQKAKEKITCECGSVYRRSNKASHNRTKKHKEFILSLSV